jgi:hypothetical protein
MFNLFSQEGSYIGYTATPFANIFIDPNDYDQAAYGPFRRFYFHTEAPSTIWVQEFS